MKYELYGWLHYNTKKLLRRSVTTNEYRMINIEAFNVEPTGEIKIENEEKCTFINNKQPALETVTQSDVFPVENIVASNTFQSYNNSFSLKQKCSEKMLGVEAAEAENLWKEFIAKSRIPNGFKNEKLHYAGFILDDDEWCLPSWIWTNAALVRMYCKIGEIDEARGIADKLIEEQLTCGGWIVRNDYDVDGAVPVLAPNDSAYIANNACLEMYFHTNEQKYLDAACRCADWIKENAREDGMIYVGFDVKRSHWQTKHNIVDVGFTSGLFARLYELTQKQEYFDFLKRFTNRYITLFYIPSKRGFATSLDSNDQQLGGMFGRGQAWALEGLIPASRVLKDEKITDIVDKTIEHLLQAQDKKGGWAYNLTRPLMGIDCKATSIIACSLMNWYQDHPEWKELKNAAQKAYLWCVKHTLPKGKGKGGIYSYTTEGAIVHHLYTWTAFVYGSSYAIELKKMIVGE